MSAEAHRDELPALAAEHGISGTRLTPTGSSPGHVSRNRGGPGACCGDDGQRCVIRCWSLEPTTSAVPWWYRRSMAMNLRLSDEEAAALRRKAEEEGRSMQDVARAAIREYTTDRRRRLAAAVERIRTEDAELLDRLSK